MCYIIIVYSFMYSYKCSIIISQRPNIALLTGWLQMTFFGYTPFYLYMACLDHVSFNLRLPQGVTTEGYVRVPLFFTTEF